MISGCRLFTPKGGRPRHCTTWRHGTHPVGKLKVLSVSGLSVTCCCCLSSQYEPTLKNMEITNLLLLISHTMLLPMKCCFSLLSLLVTWSWTYCSVIPKMIDHQSWFNDQQWWFPMAAGCCTRGVALKRMDLARRPRGPGELLSWLTRPWWKAVIDLIDLWYFMVNGYSLCQPIVTIYGKLVIYWSMDVMIYLPVPTMILGMIIAMMVDISCYFMVNGLCLMISNYWLVLNGYCSINHG